MKGFNRQKVSSIKAGLIFCLLCFASEIWAQTSNVSVGTDQLKSNAILWLNGNGTNQGLLLPAVTNRTAFTGLNNTEDKGMLIFDKSDSKVYFWNGTSWVDCGGGSGGSNQTLVLNGNTFTLSGSPASNVNLALTAPTTTGQMLVWNGTAWTTGSLSGDVSGTSSTTQVDRLKGKALPTLPVTAQALVYDGTNWIFQAISSAGEANTGSNVGTAGVGVFKQKTGVNLEFQKINAGSNRVSITQDGANSEVDIDVNQANLSIALAQVTGTGALAALSVVGTAQITDGTITNADIAPSAAIDVTKLNSGGVTNNGKVLKVVAGALAYAADDVGTGAAILNTGEVLVGNGATNSGAVVSGDLTMTAGDFQLKALSVTAAELAADAVTTGKILDGTIALGDIANDAVDATKLRDDAGVDANRAVTTNHIRDNAITTGKIADGTIANADIAAGALIDVTKLNSGGVPNNGLVLKVVAGALAFAADDVGAAAPILTAGQLLTGNGTTNSGTIVTGDLTFSAGDFQLKALTVTAAELAADAVTTAKILDGTIALGDIANDAVDATKLRDDPGVDANRAVTTNHIRDNAVTAAKIADGTITAADLGSMGAAANQVMQYDGSVWAPVLLGAGGTVTSVGLTMPSIFNVTPATITTSGTFATTLVSQTANTIFAAPSGSAGAPTFRTLTALDIPVLDASKITTGTFGVARGGTGLATTPTNGQVLIGNGAGYALSTLTQGTGVTITNGAGTITIASTGLVNPMTTLGDIIVGGAAGAPTRFAGGTGFLKSIGAATPSWSSVDLSTTDVTGTLTVANGGTGRTTWDGLLLGSGASITDISTGTNGQILRVAGTTPSWSNFAVTSADITDGTITSADLATNISINTTGNITTSAPGNLSIAGTSTLTGAATLTSLAGAGTRMVVANPAGALSTQALPVAGWGLTGNAGTAPATNYIGTSDAQDLVFKTNNVERLRISQTGLTTLTGNYSANVVISGHNLATAAGSHGVYGESDSPTSAGVFGNSFVGGNGVGGFSNTGNGISGISTSGIGVYGQSNGGSAGVYGYNPATGPGMSGTATAATQAGVFGLNDIANGYGIYGTSLNGFAGYFNGRLVANGPIGLGPTPSYGTAGQVLTSGGVGVTPSWTSISGTALSTSNVVPKGNGTNQVASSMTDNGTTLSTTADFNLATGKVIKLNNTTVFNLNTATNAIFIGQSIGASNTGLNNVFMGFQAGQDNTSGAENTFLGVLAGASNTTGGSNTYLGRGAGQSMVTGSLNTMIGFNAGSTSPGFQGTTVIGANAGRNATAGLNVFIGERAGEQSTSGQQNVFIGRNVGPTNTTGQHNILIGADADVGSGGLSNAVAIGFNSRVTASNSIVLGVAGENVGIGGVTAPNVSLDVASAAAGFVAEFDRNIATGTGILGFYRQGTLQGSISESGGTLTFNPFTGSHYATCAENLEVGTLVTMTGKNERINGDGEPVYEVVVSAQPNDSKLLGSYLHTVDEPQSINNKPIRVIMAVGNGIMWVADQGENIQVGDYLISSDVSGHAMKDQGEYDVAYVIARAAEPVEWQKETAVINGVKHKRISVFYESFTRNHKAEKLEKEVADLRAEVNSLKQDSQSKMGQMQTELENLKKMMTAFSHN